MISDVWDKGWKVLINKSKSEVIPVNYCMRGVAVDEGLSKIVLKYNPLSF